jgi:hypothetical protein
LFKQDSNVKDHIIEKWKRKYLFPFGDIGASEKHKDLNVPYCTGSGNKIFSEISKIEELINR